MIPVYTYIYIYTHIHVIHTHTHIERERERERESKYISLRRFTGSPFGAERPRRPLVRHAVSFRRIGGLKKHMPMKIINANDRSCLLSICLCSWAWTSKPL